MKQNRKRANIAGVSQKRGAVSKNKQQRASSNTNVRTSKNTTTSTIIAGNHLEHHVQFQNYKNRQEQRVKHYANKTTAQGARAGHLAQRKLKSPNIGKALYKWPINNAAVSDAFPVRAKSSLHVSNVKHCPSRQQKINEQQNNTLLRQRQQAMDNSLKQHLQYAQGPPALRTEIDEPVFRLSQSQIDGLMGRKDNFKPAVVDLDGSKSNLDFIMGRTAHYEGDLAKFVASQVKHEEQSLIKSQIQYLSYQAQKMQETQFQMLRLKKQVLSLKAEMNDKSYSIEIPKPLLEITNNLTSISQNTNLKNQAQNVTESELNLDSLADRTDDSSILQNLECKDLHKVNSTKAVKDIDKLFRVESPKKLIRLTLPKETSSVESQDDNNASLRQPDSASIVLNQEYQEMQTRPGRCLKKRRSSSSQSSQKSSQQQSQQPPSLQVTSYTMHKNNTSYRQNDKGKIAGNYGCRGGVGGLGYLSNSARQGLNQDMNDLEKLIKKGKAANINSNTADEDLNNEQRIARILDDINKSGNQQHDPQQQNMAAIQSKFQPLKQQQMASSQRQLEIGRSNSDEVIDFYGNDFEQNLLRSQKKQQLTIKKEKGTHTAHSINDSESSNNNNKVRDYSIVQTDQVSSLDRNSMPMSPKHLKYVTSQESLLNQSNKSGSNKKVLEQQQSQKYTVEPLITIPVVTDLDVPYQQKQRTPSKKTSPMKSRQNQKNSTSTQQIVISDTRKLNFQTQEVKSKFTSKYSRENQNTHQALSHPGQIKFNGSSAKDVEQEKYGSFVSNKRGSQQNKSIQIKSSSSSVNLSAGVHYLNYNSHKQWPNGRGRLSSAERVPQSIILRKDGRRSSISHQIMLAQGKPNRKQRNIKISQSKKTMKYSRKSLNKLTSAEMLSQKPIQIVKNSHSVEGKSFESHTAHDLINIETSNYMATENDVNSTARINMTRKDSVEYMDFSNEVIRKISTENESGAASQIKHTNSDLEHISYELTHDNQKKAGDSQEVIQKMISVYKKQSKRPGSSAFQNPKILQIADLDSLQKQIFKVIPNTVSNILNSTRQASGRNSLPKQVQTEQTLQILNSGDLLKPQSSHHNSQTALRVYSHSMTLNERPNTAKNGSGSPYHNQSELQASKDGCQNVEFDEKKIQVQKGSNSSKVQQNCTEQSPSTALFIDSPERSPLLLLETNKEQKNSLQKKQENQQQPLRQDIRLKVTVVPVSQKSQESQQKMYLDHLQKSGNSSVSDKKDDKNSERFDETLNLHEQLAMTEYAKSDSMIDLKDYDHGTGSNVKLLKCKKSGTAKKLKESSRYPTQNSDKRKHKIVIKQSEIQTLQNYQSRMSQRDKIASYHHLSGSPVILKEKKRHYKRSSNSLKEQQKLSSQKSGKKSDRATSAMLIESRSNAVKMTKHSINVSNFKVKEQQQQNTVVQRNSLMSKTHYQKQQKQQYNNDQKVSLQQQEHRISINNNTKLRRQKSASQRSTPKPTELIQRQQDIETSPEAGLQKDSGKGIVDCENQELILANKERNSCFDETITDQNIYKDFMQENLLKSSLGPYDQKVNIGNMTPESHKSKFIKADSMPNASASKQSIQNSIKINTLSMANSMKASNEKKQLRQKLLLASKQLRGGITNQGGFRRPSSSSFYQIKRSGMHRLTNTSLQRNSKKENSLNADLPFESQRQIITTKQSLKSHLRTSSKEISPQKMINKSVSTAFFDLQQQSQYNLEQPQQKQNDDDFAIM